MVRHRHVELSKTRRGGQVEIDTLFIAVPRNAASRFCRNCPLLQAQGHGKLQAMTQRCRNKQTCVGKALWIHVDKTKM